MILTSRAYPPQANGLGPLTVQGAVSATSTTSRTSLLVLHSTTHGDMSSFQRSLTLQGVITILGRSRRMNWSLFCKKYGMLPMLQEQQRTLNTRLLHSVLCIIWYVLLYIKTSLRTDKLPGPSGTQQLAQWVRCCCPRCCHNVFRQ